LSTDAVEKWARADREHQVNGSGQALDVNAADASILRPMEGELRKQFQYYLDHQDELVQRYRGKWVVIVGEEIVGDFDSELAAYAFATTGYEPGAFMIQLVTPGQESYSQTFRSRVAI
jgi:hypothetical protein